MLIQERTIFLYEYARTLVGLRRPRNPPVNHKHFCNHGGKHRTAFIPLSDYISHTVC